MFYIDLFGEHEQTSAVGWISICGIPFRL